MINHLYYNIKFSSTGKTFSQKIEFKPGLTVITGGNERGKSLILEMIEYSLFGAAALRGQNSDYDVLDVIMSFTIKNISHTVERTSKTTNLDKTKAVGAKAVNQEILKLLGIDLDVFRIACSAKQGELDKLTARMGSTERRKMVDEVIGLNQLELVEKQCRGEVTAIKRLRDNLAKRLIEPTEPQPPTPYIESVILEQQLRDQMDIEAERKQLLKIQEPVAPTKPTKGVWIDAIEDYESLRKEKEIERAGIERSLRAIPRATFTRSDIDNARAYWIQQERGPRPTLAREYIEAGINAYGELERLSKSVECPACGVLFIPGQGSTLNKIEPPKESLTELRSELKYWTHWEGHLNEPVFTDPIMPKNQIEVESVALGQAEARKKLEKQLETVYVLESKAHELKAKQDYERALDLYDHTYEHWREQYDKWVEAQTRLESLPEPDPQLEINLHAAHVYEEQTRRYNADILEFNSDAAEVEELNQKAEAFNTGAEALKFVRSQVKQHLIPSLNKVASYLLSEMTNGSRKRIVVDENFEVTVDGQPVRTLSGSGVSVVNLALRIALGQVLTQSIVPIFLADEIDADCDAERAAAIHAAIKKLSKNLKQIIVVSHKHIDGDQTIGV